MTACVVFDFDGVLVESNAVKRQAYFDIFESSGGGVEPTVEAVLREDIDGDRFDTIRRILLRLGAVGSNGGSETLDALVMQYAERYNDICEDYAATCGEVPGASLALAQLADRHSLYVVSATPEEPLRRIVERRGWTPRFRAVLGRPQSKPEHLRRIMEWEHVGGERVIFVGDGLRDLQAARASGCRFIGVRNRFNDFDPTGIEMVPDLRELPALIEPGAC
jgi:phosphoglycolate phosphatase